jgi:hypothetical protein
MNIDVRYLFINVYKINKYISVIARKSSRKSANSGLIAPI